MSVSTQAHSVDWYLGLIILMPSFFGYMSIGAAQLLFIAISVVIGFFILCINKRHGYPQLISKIPIIFTCQLICYILTVLTNSVNPFSSITAKDATDIVRPALYLLYFSIPVLLRYDSVKCIKIVAIGIGIGVMLDLLKFIPSFYPVMKLYTNLNPNGLNYARFNGTFAYCYSFGFVLMLLLGYAFNASYKYRKISIGILLLLIFLTGSRAILLGTVFLILFQIIFFGGSFLTKMKMIIGIISSLIIAYLILSVIEVPMITEIFDLLERGLNSVMGDGTDASFNTRGGQLARALANFERNPIFGVGPQKGTELPIEILVGYYISSWGIIGALCYLFIWLCFVYNAYRCTKFWGPAGAFSKANFLWLFIVPFAGMSTPITDGTRTAPIYFFIQGIQAVILIRHFNYKYRLYLADQN